MHVPNHLTGHESCCAGPAITGAWNERKSIQVIAFPSLACAPRASTQAFPLFNKHFYATQTLACHGDTYAWVYCITGRLPFCQNFKVDDSAL